MQLQIICSFIHAATHTHTHTRTHTFSVWYELHGNCLPKISLPTFSNVVCRFKSETSHFLSITYEWVCMFKPKTCQGSKCIYLCARDKMKSNNIRSLWQLHCTVMSSSGGSVAWSLNSSGVKKVISDTEYPDVWWRGAGPLMSTLEGSLGWMCRGLEVNGPEEGHIHLSEVTTDSNKEEKF